MTTESLFLTRGAWLSMVMCVLVCGSAAMAQGKSKVPGWVVFPGKEWVKITPAQAGFDVAKFEKMVGAGKPNGKKGEKGEKGAKWGAVLTRGGYFVHAWGDPDYKHQTASLGKAFTWAVLGLAVDEGLLKPSDPIHKSWTGKGLLSHPHKYLDRGNQKTLTWMHLLNHQGGIPISGGHNWKKGAGGAYSPPAWAKCTEDVMFDNYCHAKPGTKGMYSSAGYWRLGQALTAVWKKDMKKVLDEKLFRHMGIPADRWDWTTGGLVHFKRDFYPHMVGYGDFLDPPYYIDGQVVRGGPGWVIMSAKDLARFGLLVATGGVWKGKRLISSRWIRGHGGGNNSGVSGNRTTFVAWGVVTAQAHPRPGVIVGPVDLSRGSPKAPAVPKNPRPSRKSSKAPAAAAPVPRIAAAPAKLFDKGYALAWQKHSFYVDGKLVASRKVPGDLSNWDHSHPLLLGNETSADRAWAGEIYGVTFFNRALTKLQVAKRFAGK